MTLQEIYEQLRRQYLSDYGTHFQDEYKGQNKVHREATKFAIRYTVEEWRKQHV